MEVLVSAAELRELKPFLNEIGQLTAFPAKHKKQLMALWYLAEKIEPCKEYTEPEINGIINSWHTFGDQATLKGSLSTSGSCSETGNAAAIGRRRTRVL